MPSALIQTLRDTALEAVKATKFKKCLRKKKYSSIRYDKRTITLRGEQVTLSCLGKRQKTVLSIYTLNASFYFLRIISFKNQV